MSVIKNTELREEFEETSEKLNDWTSAIFEWFIINSFSSSYKQF